MISADVAKVLEELKAYHADTVRRLENMVKGFSYIISKTAIENTPLGNALEIVALERKIENIPFKIDENNEVIFYGFIDRIDILNGTLRIIDYKTAKPKNLKIKIKEDKIENLFFDDKYKQAMQLCIYQYCISQIDEFKNRDLGSDGKVKSVIIIFLFNSF
jgi:ATP-dependent exoDNAse (exonuclease V) beta subunit